MKEVKKIRPKRSIYFFLALAVIGVSVYAGAALIKQQVSIKEKEEELASLNEQLIVQNIKNDEIKRVYDSTDEENKEYIEKIAREEYDYAKIGERIFVNIAGD